MFGLQVAVCACLWDLQRVALGGVRWRPVISAHLASNALSNIAPGGGPLGAALQYRIFVAAGLDKAKVVSALTAVNLLVFSVVLGLPVLAVPGLLRGSVNRDLLESGGRGRGGVRGDRRRRGAADDDRAAVGLGGPGRAVRPQPAPAAAPRP